MKNIGDIKRDVILEKHSGNNVIAAFESDTGIFPIFVRFYFGDDGIADNRIQNIDVNGGSPNRSFTIMRHTLNKAFDIGKASKGNKGRSLKPNTLFNQVKNRFRAKKSGNYLTVTIDNFDDLRLFASQI